MGKCILAPNSTPMYSYEFFKHSVTGDYEENVGHIGKG